MHFSLSMTNIGSGRIEINSTCEEVRTEPNSACQFFQKHTAARGPRTGLLSSKIESIDGRVKF